MSGSAIQAKVHRGYGIAGRKVGLPHEHYRPTGPLSPLRLLNRLGTLLVALDARPSYNFNAPAMHNDAARYALVDGREVQAADYLVGPQETVFVAALPMLQPIVCFACNVVLSMARAAAPDFGVIDEAPAPGSESQVFTGWPASMLYAGRGGGDDMAIPGDVPPPQFIVLMPVVPGIEPPHAGDVLVDERGRRFSVSWFEASTLGWRMAARHLAIA